MEIIAMELSAVLLLVAIILLLRRQRGTAFEGGPAQLTQVEELARSAELTKQTCFRALEKLDKNVSSLELRTTLAEHQLADLAQAPSLERKEHYEAAALLLAAGHDGNRIATMLDLPLVQVEMIRDLKIILAGESKVGAEVDSPQPLKTVKRKSVARSAKGKVRPIVLTDAVEPDHPVNGRVHDRRSAINGAAA